MSPAQASTSSSDVVTAYLRLGLAFDRLEEGFVDAYTGDPNLRAAVGNAPAPQPAELADVARGLLADLPGDLDPDRSAFVLGRRPESRTTPRVGSRRGYPYRWRATSSR